MDTTDIQSVREFFTHFPSKKYEADSTLLSPGMHATDIFYLVSGHVREYLVSQEGVELTVHIYESGATFPLIPAMHNFETERYYQAIEECEVRIAPATELFDFLKSHPDILFHTMGRLLLGMQGLVKRIEYLTLNKASARLAASLLYLGRHFGKTEGRSIVFTQRFTHREIASLVGLARETVSLELEQMVSGGLLTFEGRLMVIPDVQALENIVEL